MLDNEDVKNNTNSRADINNNNIRNATNVDNDTNNVNNNNDANETTKPILQRLLHLSDRATQILFIVSFVVVLVLQLYTFNPPQYSKTEDAIIVNKDVNTNVIH